MSILLDGKKARDFYVEALSKAVLTLPRKPKLKIIQIGNREDSNSYILQKKKFGERIGVEVLHTKLDINAKEVEVIEEIKRGNLDKDINGIIVQLPLPDSLDKVKILDSIDPLKDIDGLTSENMRLLLEGRSRFIPATPKGVVSLLEYNKIPIEGKKVTVVGRSSLVGKPMMLTFLERNATVTICHKITKNLAEETKRADILVVATGSPHLIGRQHVSSGQVVIDVGINSVTGTKFDEEVGAKKFIGDVDFDSVKNIVEAISPVPGGVGPMTVLSLFQNLVKASVL